MNEITKLPVRQQEETTIDLLDLSYALLEKWHLLVLCTLVGALLVNAYTFFFVKPTYESTAKLYIVSASGDNVVDLTDLNIGTSLTNDYQELIMSYPVLNRVISSLKLDMDDEDLRKIISISNPSNTRVITITAKTNDAQLSMDIANTMAGVVQNYLPETMSTVRPNVAQVARLARRKSGPSYAKMTVLGAVIGFIIIAGILTVRYLADDTIRTAEDMEKVFGIRPLSSVPENREMHLGDNTQRTQRRRKKRLIPFIRRSAS